MEPDTLGPYWRQLLERAAPDGGFAAAPAGPSRPDATAWAAMALHAGGGPPEMVTAARGTLAGAQTPDGRVPYLPERPETGWPTALALAAWLPDPDFTDQAARAAAWLLGHPGKAWPGDKNGIFGHDTSLAGWNWIEGTHSWVEPTAQVMLALSALPAPPEPALAEGARLLVDRQLPGGGWNYGNTRVFRNILLPIPECTGHALAALAGRAEPETVAASLAYLAGPDCASPTPLAAAWRAFGLGAWGRADAAVLGNLAVTLARQERHGPYDTALVAQLLAAAASRGRFSAIVARSAHA
ncbi:MAG: prenyltransferase/squalene oxidase repeat-containing protein [Solidesulfovibrio sp.]|uniref:prenyltransferase/squalene oxidase repeat-containing protein n=2 Tax=Solidesulfovibrio sp. TaxID=2910990 RepID=UPI00315833AD